ncbi:MAG: hypothetical protein WCY12_04345 [Candidatus Omnitrophota bacterium]
MRERRILLSVIFLCSFLVSGVSAETIKLKSGQQIQGRIIERTDSYVKVEIAGTPLTYFLDDISSIEAEQPVSSEPQIQSAAGQSPSDLYKEAWKKEFNRQKAYQGNYPGWYFSLQKIKGVYLIIFALLILLSLFFGFSLKAILTLVAGLAASIIARMIFNNASAANVISYICAIFTAYFVMKSEVFRG